MQPNSPRAGPTRLVLVQCAHLQPQALVQTQVVYIVSRFRVQSAAKGSEMLSSQAHAKQGSNSRSHSPQDLMPRASIPRPTSQSATLILPCKDRTRCQLLVVGDLRVIQPHPQLRRQTKHARKGATRHPWTRKRSPQSPANQCRCLSCPLRSKTATAGRKQRHCVDARAWPFTTICLRGHPGRYNLQRHRRPLPSWAPLIHGRH